jgi:hypothetical protein
MATKTEKQQRAMARNLALGSMSQMSSKLKALRRKANDMELQLRCDRALSSLWSLEHYIRDNNYESWKA